MFLQNVTIFALAIAGLCTVSLAMERHAKQAFGKAQPSPRRRARAGLGAVILFLSLLSSVQAYGASIGIAVFFGTSGVVSAGIALAFSYRPRFLPLLGAGAALLAFAAFAARFALPGGFF
jgi:hypothetical protein